MRVKKQIITIAMMAGLLASPFVAKGLANVGNDRTTTTLNDGEGILVNPAGGNPPVIIVNPFGGGGILNPPDPPTPTGGGGNPSNPKPGTIGGNFDAGFQAVSYDDLDTFSGGAALGGNNGTTLTDPDEASPPPEGGDGDSAINYGLVEQRPDFQFDDGQRLFQQAATSSAGQKSLGIAPAVAADGPKFVPVGEF